MTLRQALFQRKLLYQSVAAAGSLDGHLNPFAYRRFGQYGIGQRIQHAWFLSADAAERRSTI
jgi:hypothetical protein